MASEKAGDRTRRRNIVKKREGFLMMVVKSSWYTVCLILFLFGGAVIFMGIEGNHEEFYHYKLVEQRHKFSHKLKRWMLSDSPRAKKLREHLGLKNSMSVEKYRHILDKQHDANITHILKYVQTRCNHVRNQLTSWNTKSWGDSFMFAVSTMSTVGWGVFSPPDTKVKIVTLFYLLFGVPIFGGLIGHIGNFFDWFEQKMMSKKWVQKYLGDVFTMVQILFAIIVVILYVLVMEAFVEVEKEDGLRALLVEADEDDEWNFFVALYYTVQTVTTIGFGDVYIFSPRHPLLHIAPVVSVMLTAFIIAVFGRIFAQFKAKLERSSAKTMGARPSVGSAGSISMGVIKINRAVEKELNEIVEETEEKVEENNHGMGTKPSSGSISLGVLKVNRAVEKELNEIVKETEEKVEENNHDIRCPQDERIAYE